MPPYPLPVPTTHTYHICGEYNGIYYENYKSMQFIPDSIMIAQIGSNPENLFIFSILYCMYVTYGCMFVSMCMYVSMYVPMYV